MKNAYTEMVTDLKEFGFKDLSLLDQHTIFEMLETYRVKKIKESLRVTINKFQKQKVSPHQFLSYWLAVTKNKHERVLHRNKISK